MSMQTLTWDVDAAAVAGNSDTYSLALATQARQKLISVHDDSILFSFGTLFIHIRPWIMYGCMAYAQQSIS